MTASAITITIDEKSQPKNVDILIAPQRNIGVREKHLKELEKKFNALCQEKSKKIENKTITDEEVIRIEKEKLKIVETVNEYVHKQYKHDQIKKAVVEKKNSLWREVLFYFLISADIVLMSIGGYIGSMELLLMIPNMTESIGIFVSTVATVIEAGMMYSIFKPFLQKGMGIVSAPESESLAKIYNQRLDLMEQINATIVNNPSVTRSQGPEIYESYASILKTLNRDIKATELLPFKEPVYKKGLRHFLTGINFLLSMAGTYFGTVMLLTAASAALIGTPVGWAIIGAFIIAQLITRLVIRQTSVFSLLNPFAKEHTLTRHKLQSFKKNNVDIENKVDSDLQDLHFVQEAMRQRQIEKFKSQNIELENKINSMKSQPNYDKKLTKTKAIECPIFLYSETSLERTLAVSSSSKKSTLELAMRHAARNTLSSKNVKDKNSIITEHKIAKEELLEPNPKKLTRSAECPYSFYSMEQQKVKEDERNIILAPAIITTNGLC